MMSSTAVDEALMVLSDREPIPTRGRYGRGIPRAMSTETPLLLALDFTGTLVFALNGALTAVRAERLDIFGVITLGMFTGLGGGVIRDVLLDALPTGTVLHSRHMPVAAARGRVGVP